VKAFFVKLHGLRLTIPPAVIARALARSNLILIPWDCFGSYRASQWRNGRVGVRTDNWQIRRTRSKYKYVSSQSHLKITFFDKNRKNKAWVHTDNWQIQRIQFKSEYVSCQSLVKSFFVKLHGLIPTISFCPLCEGLARSNLILIPRDCFGSYRASQWRNGSELDKMNQLFTLWLIKDWIASPCCRRVRNDEVEETSFS